MTHPTEPHEHAAAGLDESMWLPDDEVKRALYGDDDGFTLIEWLLLVAASFAIGAAVACFLIFIIVLIGALIGVFA
jgi:hypothetical protein